MLERCSTIELHPQPVCTFLAWLYIPNSYFCIEITEIYSVQKPKHGEEAEIFSVKKKERNQNNLHNTLIKISKKTKEVKRRDGIY